MLFVIINRVRQVQNLLFSMLIKHGFRSVGDNFRIEYPLRAIGGKYITLGNNFKCFGNLRIEAYDRHNELQYNPQIFIGNDVSINYDCHIGCINKIKIGNGVLIASKVFITDHFHGDTTLASVAMPPSLRPVWSKGPVIIKDNVWIGENVCIMPNVTIGENSIIGANSTVTKSFGPNSVIGGSPAKLIRTITE